MTLAPLDYERSVIDQARRALESVASAVGRLTLRVFWSETRHGRMPVLSVQFDDHAVRAGSASCVPALGIGLVVVEQGTLLEVSPGRTLLDGDRLRDKILRSVEDYVTKNGIRSCLDPEQAERFARRST